MERDTCHEISTTTIPLGEPLVEAIEGDRSREASARGRRHRTADAVDDVAVEANRLVPVAVEVLDVRVARRGQHHTFPVTPTPRPHDRGAVAPAAAQPVELA